MGFRKITVCVDNGLERIHNVVRDIESDDMYIITEFDGIRDIIYAYNPNKIVSVKIEVCDLDILNIMLEHGKITPNEMREAMDLDPL